jgi:glycerophosphoryl diester phosphodiesterase
MAQIPAFEIQGHRGARGLMPENTLEAFKVALENNVETLELDVVISKDKKVVVSHEPYFNPRISTDPKGQDIQKKEQYNLYQMTYAQIKKFDVGKKGNDLFPNQQKLPAYKPLLSEVISYVNQLCKAMNRQPPKYNIEIKSEAAAYGLSQPSPNVFCDLVLKTIGKSIPQKNLCLQSFDFNVLSYLNTLNYLKKRFDISVLLEAEDENEVGPVLEKLGFTPDIWSPYYKTLNPERVKALKDMHIRVIPWTVNEVSDMRNIKKMACDGLITDYPNRVKDI